MTTIPLRIWNKVNHAIKRCTDKHDIAYRGYGGRGIRVCDVWLNDRRAFADYLMALPGWDDTSLWLDRIDNDGHYEPGNLRFVTPSESNYNRRHKDEVIAEEVQQQKVREVEERQALEADRKSVSHVERFKTIAAVIETERQKELDKWKAAKAYKETMRFLRNYRSE